MFYKFCVTFFIFFSSNVFAACYPELIDYSLEAEVQRSPAIIIATPIKHTWVNDVQEPDFYAGSIYQLKVHQTLYSKVQGEIILWDPNNSARFAPDIGKKYLFILYQNNDGLLAVDYCGNSGLIEKKENLLPLIRELISEL